jgi:hypothetical protein
MRLFLGAGIFGATSPAFAIDPGPQNLVRQFCQLDANGARLIAGRWNEIAPLVAWPFHPAWDQISFITGYEISSTRALEEGRLAVDVDYSVVGEASAFGFEPVSYIDRVTFVLATSDEIHWSILGPMIAPRVFGNRVSVEDVVATLRNGRDGFVSNSLFVNQLIRSAGWDVPYERAVDLLSGNHYAPTDDPQPGDLVVYVQDGVVYHVGLLTKNDRVVSSTLNGGIVRTTLNAFPGEVRYLRLLDPERLPTPTVVGP